MLSRLAVKRERGEQSVKYESNHRLCCSVVNPIQSMHIIGFFLITIIKNLFRLCSSYHRSLFVRDSLTRFFFHSLFAQHRLVSSVCERAIKVQKFAHKKRDTIN